MASGRQNSSKTGKTTAKSGAVERSNSDSARWIIGLMIFIIGLVMMLSVMSFFFTWKHDASLLSGIDADNPMADNSAANMCGKGGAWIGDVIVNRGFGLFGVVLPLLITMVGVRVIRRRSLLFNHSFLGGLLVMVVGSLTLGLVDNLLGEQWAIFGSGWGGACGIEVAGLLKDAMGTFGSSIILFACWILIGVFINRNFINTVNSAGSAVVDRSEDLFASLMRRIKGIRGEDESVTETQEVADEPQNEVGQVDFVPQTTVEQDVASQPTEPQTANEEHNPRYVVRPSVADSVNADDEVEEEEQYRAPVVLNDIYGTFVPESMRRADSSQTMIAVEVDGGTAADNVADNPAETDFAEQPYSFSVVEQQSDRSGDMTIDEVVEDSNVAEPQPSSVMVEQSGGVTVTVEEHQAKILDEEDIDTSLYDPTKDLHNFKMPTVGLLENYISNSKVDDREIFDNKSRIESTLRNFGIPIQRIHATPGPTVTLYEIVQADGVKISKIQGLQKDIAQSLKALGIRIIAPIPGKGTIGIEVPNIDKQIVSMYSSVCSPEFQSTSAELPVVIGRTIQNENLVFDLAKMPHLLVAGATGQGKSVGLNAIITSLLYKKHPSELKFVMIDPKMVEFSFYSKLERHYLAKMESEEEAIITDARKAVNTLNALCIEMDNRLELCKRGGAKNIKEYNNKFMQRRLDPRKGHRFLPYIVVVIDEFADLIMTAKEVEGPVMRLAQKARAIGIHLIIATQRPDVRVITGGIKANFPARIAFRVMQMIDSRTIIDQPGAEQLIGRGDMLLSKDGELTRIQCALVDTPEVERIVDYIAGQQGYGEAYNLPDYVPESGSGDAGGLGSEDLAPVKYDSLFAEIARAAVTNGQMSVSSIQRNYEVGFNRAGRIMMQLERAGIVGKQEGAKPRAILFHDLPSLEARLQELGLF